jgi:hypothetical protein
MNYAFLIMNYVYSIFVGIFDKTNKINTYNFR